MASEIVPVCTGFFVEVEDVRILRMFRFALCSLGMFLRSLREREREKERERERERRVDTGGSSRHRAAFFVVSEGRQAGLFSKWSDCRRSVAGFEGARYWGFCMAGCGRGFYGLFEY